ncbi:MAG: HTTM domain-containing protein, partial [Myxococcota bacterium]
MMEQQNQTLPGMTIFNAMVNNAPLIVFRILFGLLMIVESIGAIATGWVHRAFIEPRMTFTILPQGWPQPLPGYGMYGWFVAMAIASAGVMVGYRTRLSATALALLWSGAYLMQKTHYNNHYYLAVILCWVMVILPVHLRASYDEQRLGQRIEACPQMIIRAFQLQTGIVFTFAAIAKLDPGWGSGNYLAVVFGQKAHYPILGPLLGDPLFQRFIATSGIFFDALIIPALAWRRTRLFALVGL